MSDCSMRLVTGWHATLHVQSLLVKKVDLWLANAHLRHQYDVGSKSCDEEAGLFNAVLAH